MMKHHRRTPDSGDENLALCSDGSLRSWIRLRFLSLQRERRAIQCLKLCLTLTMALCPCGFEPCLGSEAADLVLTNAKVYTMEADRPWASSVVIAGNRIVAVLARDEGASIWTSPDTRVVDLKGQFVIPGFIDAAALSTEPIC